MKKLTVALAFVFALSTVSAFVLPQDAQAATSKKEYRKTCTVALKNGSTSYSVGVEDKRVVYKDGKRVTKEVYVPGPFKTTHFDGFSNQTSYKYRYVTIKVKKRTVTFSNKNNTFKMKTLFKLVARDGSVLDKSVCVNNFTAVTNTPYLYTGNKVDDGTTRI